MCGNTRAPSIVGRLAVVSKEGRLGSFIFGPVQIGVQVRIEEEIELSADQRTAFESGNPGESAPDYFYNVELVTGVDGNPASPAGKALAGQIVLFRDEFDLAD